MFGVATAIASAMGAVAEERAFESQVELMPVEFRQSARDHRQKAMQERTAERRHREMVEATRQRSSGILPFLFGFLLGRA